MAAWVEGYRDGHGGAQPIGSLRGRWAKAAAEMLAERGAPLVAAAMRRCGELGKSPGDLPYVLGDLEREGAGHRLRFPTRGELAMREAVSHTDAAHLAWAYGQGPRPEATT